MLLYTKIVEEEGKKVRKIYGTIGNVPTDSDEEVVYKDADGAELELEANDIYVDNGNHSIKRLSDESVVNVFLADGTQVIPTFITPVPTTKYKLTVNEVENCVVTGAGEYEDKTVVKVTVAPAEGYEFGEGNAPKANGHDMEVEMGRYSYEFDIDGHDVDVEITGVVVTPVTPVED